MNETLLNILAFIFGVKAPHYSNDPTKCDHNFEFYKDKVKFQYYKCTVCGKIMKEDI